MRGGGGEGAGGAERFGRARDDDLGAGGAEAIGDDRRDVGPEHRDGAGALGGEAIAALGLDQGDFEGAVPHDEERLGAAEAAPLPCGEDDRDDGRRHRGWRRAAGSPARRAAGSKT